MKDDYYSILKNIFISSLISCNNSFENVFIHFVLIFYSFIILPYFYKYVIYVPWEKSLQISTLRNKKKFHAGKENKKTDFPYKKETSWRKKKFLSHQQIHKEKFYRSTNKVNRYFHWIFLNANSKLYFNSLMQCNNLSIIRL